MATTIIWKQIFSNYQLTDFQIPHEQITSYQHNVSGNQVQVAVTNRFDDLPLVIDGLWLSPNADFTSAIALTYNQQAQFAVPAEQILWTDPAEFQLLAGQRFFLKLRAHNQTQHLNTLGNTSHLALMQLLKPQPTEQRDIKFFGIGAIRCQTAVSQPTLTIFGDSLTGRCYLSASLARALYQALPQQITVINAGIFDNRFLQGDTGLRRRESCQGAAGLQRFVSDVLYDQPQSVLIMVGLADLVQAGAGAALTELPTGAQLINGLQRLTKICQRRQIKLIPTTIPPFAGAHNERLAIWQPAKENVRQQINQFLTTQPLTIDLANYVADPQQSAHLASRFDSGDHLHFSSQGAKLAGQFISAELTKKGLI